MTFATPSRRAARRPAKRALWTAIGGAAAAYGAICLALFVFQDRLIYLPPARTQNSVDSTIALPVDDARLLVSVRPAEGRRALLYFGGNAEDVSLTLPALAQALPDRALYLLHYRGYAGSSGSPSEAANRRDAVALIDLARSEHPEVAILGRSLGTGVAVFLASKRPVSDLALVTPFDSLEEIAATQFPLFPVRLLLRDRYDSWRIAPAITAPTTIIAAELDEVVPFANTERLFKHFVQGSASMRILRGVGHNSISQHPEYMAIVREAL